MRKHAVSFVKNCRQKEVTSKSMSMDDLYTLCLKCRNEYGAKNGPGIIPSKITEGEGQTKTTKGKVGKWRQSHLCETTSLLCLDIEDYELSDDKDRILDHIRDKIPGIEFLAWTTYSHGVREVDGREKWQPGYPRFRLVIPLAAPVESYVEDGISEYDALFEWAISYFEGVDQAARDPSRISYLPRKKAPKAELDPWIHHEDDGEPLDAEELPDGSSVAEQIEAIKEEREASKREAVDYAEKSGFTEAQLRSALDHVGCYDDRDNWLRIGMALHHYAHAEQQIEPETAFGLWDEWSEQSANYGGTREAWDSFSSGGELSEDVSIGTLIHHAQNGGWSPPRKGSMLSRTGDAYLARRVVSDHYRRKAPSSVKITELTGSKRSKEVPAADLIPNHEAAVDPVWDLGELWCWEPDEMVWSELLKEHVMTCVADYSGRPVFRGEDRKPKPLSVSSSKTKGVYDLIKARAKTERADFFEDSYAGVQCQNGAVVEQAGEILFVQPGHPLLRQRHQLSVDFDLDADCPKFEDFLNTCFEGCDDRKDRIKLLQEYAGALVFGRAWETQKILLLKGPGGGGKSQFIKIVSALFDRDDIASVSPQDMGDKHRPAQLVRARANIVADVDKKELLTTGVLKQITGTDWVTVERKYRDPITVQLTCGHLFSCNTLPQTTDNSAGFWSRWHLCLFPHDFRGTDKEEKGLGEKIIDAELAGVLRWAIEGYARLIEQDLQFTVPMSSKVEKAKWRRDCDPVELFVHEECREVASPREGQTADQLYTRFKLWADRYGRGRGMASNTFCQHLSNLGIEKKRIQKSGDRQVYYAVTGQDTPGRSLLSGLKS